MSQLSDHRVVLSARMRLSLRKSKTTSRKTQYDWQALTTDNNLQHQYTIEVKNRYEILSVEQEDATDKYNSFIIANKEAAERLIPAKK